jgi:hypothetical protein
VEKHTVVAVDIAKTKFEIAVSEEPGRVNRHRRLDRSEFLPFFAQTPRATVVMEACGSAHHWAREIQGLGHTVVLLPPHQVRPYVTRNKTDRTDAKGILEAYRNADIRPVPVKTIPQHVLGAIHRFRSGWIASRTAQVNTRRGLLRELGLVIPEGIEKVLPQVRLFVADADSGIPDGLRGTIMAACDEIEALGERIAQAERQLEALAEQTPLVARLRSVPGRGPDDVDCPRRLRGRRPALPVWSPLRELSRPHAAGVLDRSETPPGPDLEAWRFIPAHATDPRRPIGAVPREEGDGPRPATDVGNAARAADAAQQGRRRAREQAGADRVGGVEARPGVRVDEAGGVGGRAE